MRYRILCLLVLVALATGCSRSQNQPETATGPVPQLPNIGPAPVPALPTDILVDVNGARLIRKDADQEVERRLAAIRDQIPPERLDQEIPRLKEGILGDVVRQFVDRTLIVREADRCKVEVSDADLSNAYQKIEATMPKGQTLEQAIKDSPVGEERMREEIKLSVRINKLFETVLSNDWNVTDAEVDAFAKENEARLTLPETVEARHILISVESTDDEKAKAEKKAQLEGIRKQIIDGADFAEMARQHSKCPSSRNGGNLGKFPRGQMVPPFDNAAFSQKVNEIGDIVETTFGYHIIQVLEHQQGGPMPRERLVESVRNQKMQKAAVAFLRDLRAKAKIVYGNISSPTPVQQDMPMPAETP